MTFLERDAMEAFLVWLRDRHLGDVRAAGALDAVLVVADEPNVIEARYRFASRDAFEVYEREQAPRLRADGIAELARIGAADGVTFTRSTGEIVTVL
jgi:hypothetical protein